MAGARVVATDLTPELVDIGRERAAAHGLDIDWQEADAEHLPFADAEFDVVLSCVGVMFAPFHQPVADELVRVTRPGGRIALINWTPSGLHRAAVRDHEAVRARRRRPGATPGRCGATRPTCARCSATGVTDLRAQRRMLRVDRFASAAEFREFFAYVLRPDDRGVPQDRRRPGADRRLDQALIDLADEFGAASGTMEWEYLLVVADVAGSRC